ncbi:MAG: 3-deoxy-D-manno-octulosonic acid transferase [Mariprofundaceae bacterium]
MSLISEKWRQHLTLELPPTPSYHPIWVHACSVGEIASIVPLVKALLEQGHHLHITVVTKTGMQHAIRNFGDNVSLSYLPWDLPTNFSRFVAQLQPQLLLLTETEFWPGMLRACRKLSVPIIGINTRISDRSFPRYFASRILWRRWLANVSMFLAQSEIDANRLRDLGVRVPIHTLGNLKYATQAPDVDANQLRMRFDPEGHRPIFLAASTHEGEEKEILNHWRAWKQIRPDLLLMIVPRHPERFDKVGKSIAAHGFSFCSWSEGTVSRSDIVLIDAMGILTQLYTIVDIAFIGGSLAKVGGHNPLEAAICGRGVITGPHIENFQTVVQEMRQYGAAIVTSGAIELDQVVKRMLQHPSELQQMHVAAVHFMQGRSNVLPRVLHQLKPWLSNIHD